MYIYIYTFDACLNCMYRFLYIICLYRNNFCLCHGASAMHAPGHTPVTSMEACLTMIVNRSSCPITGPRFNHMNTVIVSRPSVGSPNVRVGGSKVFWNMLGFCFGHVSLNPLYFGGHPIESFHPGHGLQGGIRFGNPLTLSHTSVRMTWDSKGWAFLFGSQRQWALPSREREGECHKTTIPCLSFTVRNAKDP